MVLTLPMPLVGDAICKTLRKAVRERREWAIENLCELVRAETTLGNEGVGQRLMAAIYSEMGLQVDSFDCDPVTLSPLPGYAAPIYESYEGRPNVVGVYDPPKSVSGRSLILNGHIDVVPPGKLSLWTNPPFEPVIKNKKVFGRGAGDMKAGLVSNCVAFLSLRDIGVIPAGRLIFQSVIDEECTGNGTLACLARGYYADAAIIPEPFDMTVLTAQVGVLWVHIEATGRSAHVLDISKGANAIIALYEIYSSLQQLENEWNRSELRPDCFQHIPHPINFNLGTIEGGDWASSVPNSAAMQVRVAFYPNQSIAEIKARIENQINSVLQNSHRLQNITATLTFKGHAAEGFVMSPNSALIEELTTAHALVTDKMPEMLVSTATTDARIFELYGKVPATCYGPRGGDFHGVNEWVDIDSMLDVANVIALFILSWCGGVPASVQEEAFT